jgi:hypothetical protein
MSVSGKKLRVLVAYSAANTHVQTTVDYLRSFQLWPDCEVQYVHVTGSVDIGFSLNEFDVVINNYCSRLCFENYVSKSYIDNLVEFSGIKVLCIQDEYDLVENTRRMISKIGFDIVFTCVPEEYIEYVYPKERFPSTIFETVLTGYVPDDVFLNGSSPPPLAERPIWVGYRGRDIGPRYGQLAYDKFRIGPQVRSECVRLGIPNDIAVDEASRLYGPAWPAFISSCRTMLGTESGSNVFDFDGSIQKLYKDLTNKRGGVPTYEEFLPIVAEREQHVSMGQISPRVFECALYRTVMVLFRGQYSGILKPGVHYVSLEKDLSNLEAVLASIADIDYLTSIAERAYEDIIASGKYTYRAFAGLTCRRVRDVASRRRMQKLLAPTRAAPFWQEMPSNSPYGMDHVIKMDVLRLLKDQAGSFVGVRHLLLRQAQSHLEKLQRIALVLRWREQNLDHAIARVKKGQDNIRLVVEEITRSSEYDVADPTLRDDAKTVAKINQISELQRRLESAFGDPLQAAMTEMRPLHGNGFRKTLQKFRYQAELTYALRFVTLKSMIRRRLGIN